MKLIILLIICVFLTGCSHPSRDMSDRDRKCDIEITVHANSDYCDTDDNICPPPDEYLQK